MHDSGDHGNWESQSKGDKARLWDDLSPKQIFRKIEFKDNVVLTVKLFSLAEISSRLLPNQICCFGCCVQFGSSCFGSFQIDSIWTGNPLSKPPMVIKNLLRNVFHENLTGVWRSLLLQYCAQVDSTEVLASSNMCFVPGPPDVIVCVRVSDGRQSFVRVLYAVYFLLFVH